ncbi:hypothetical protein QBC37DRAFT_388672 [Rhypophila decipiens]|uniref:Uncharacterized protein n=1 Tax=Rhypophila decipiens TaxID=261697 RepID=A0AAN6Y9P9_9PEZI|nr:hypothetical protein QBC37DRAFT_388672 [Rhypophila decipiens]
MLVTAPPPIHGWQDLQMAQASLSDAVLTCVDFENIDHYVNNNEPINKLSEVGIATIDLRRLRRPLDQVEFEDVAKAVEFRHTIVKTWDWVTPKTCPAGWHEKQNKAHIADPYNCRFSESRIAPNGTVAMERASQFIGTMAKWNRGMAKNNAPNPLEVAQAQPSTAESPTNEQFSSTDDSSTTGSPVDIWDANQSDTDSEAAWSSGEPYEDWEIPATEDKSFDQPDTTFWELQKLRQILWRWNNTATWTKQQPSCSDLLESLGIRIPSLHNACNDAVAELLAFLRILKMTEDEYTAWMAGGHLNPVVLDIFNRDAHKANRQMEKDMQWRREQSALRRKGNGKAKAKRAAP